jgi:putative DNA primase/helicase
MVADVSEIQRTLLSHGLRLSDNRTHLKLVAKYIHDSNPKERIRAVDKVGWHGDIFVLPDGCIGATDEEVVFTASHECAHHLKVQGTVTSWRENVGRLCSGNHRLVFAVSCAFAAPLMSLLREPGGGFHFYGQTSSGKTTLLKVAGSVCGGGGPNKYVDSWKATANGLEALAASRNDLLLCLDELGQADPEVVSECTYALANGMGKQRMAKTTDARRRAEWRTLFLSTGEITITAHMQQVNRKMQAGQEVRTCPIPADAGKNFGIFDEIHGCASAGEFARTLSENAVLYYGAPLRALVGELVKGKMAATKRAESLAAAFLERNAFSRVGEITRAASRFATAAAAGELASQFGITGWRLGEASLAAEVCFHSWLRARGTAGALDDLRLLRQIRYFLQTYGAARFQQLPMKDFDRAPSLQRSGFRMLHGGECVYLIHPEAFRDEICKGFDPRRALQLLNEGKYLLHSERRLLFQKRIAAINRTNPCWFVAIRGAFLATAEEELRGVM